MAAFQKEQAKTSDDKRHDQESSVDKLTAAVLASFVQNNNHTGRNQGRQNSQFRTDRRASIECLNCHKTGHVYKNCWSASEADKNKIREQQKLKWEALNAKGAAITSQ